jgi:hypothetical protein
VNVKIAGGVEPLSPLSDEIPAGRSVRSAPPTTTPQSKAVLFATALPAAPTVRSVSVATGRSARVHSVDVRSVPFFDSTMR